MRSTILVTGAAGFAGSHLLDLLAPEGDDLVAWHRPGGHPPREVPGVRWDAVDLLDRARVDAAIQRARPSLVYHCAGAAHVGRAWDSTTPTFAINVRGTHHVLDALERAGFSARVLLPSSALVYRSSDRALTESDPLAPASPYALSKLAQEMLAARTNGALEVVIARPFNHFGPRQDPFFAASGFARRIADIERGRWAPEISVGNLDARRDLTDVRDTVRAYLALADSGVPLRPYNVCSGRAHSMREILDLLLSMARVQVAIEVDPARMRPADTPIVLGSHARLTADTGWRPEIPLEQTLSDLLDYWRAREAQP
jgi:GDP-4-dehydro-6-deoxy-D-mannose reductase